MNGVDLFGDQARPMYGWGSKGNHDNLASMNMVRAIQAALGIKADGKFWNQTKKSLELFGLKSEKVGQKAINLLRKLLTQEFSWPVKGFSRITSYFGYRDVRDIPGASNPHGGLDIGTNGKQRHPNIFSIGYGVVTKINNAITGPGGRTVTINYGFGREVRYCHLNTIDGGLRYGTIVDSNITIGTIGNSSTLRLTNGKEIGEHLHVTYLLNGEAQNPLDIISQP